LFHPAAPQQAQRIPVIASSKVNHAPGALHPLAEGGLHSVFSTSKIHCMPLKSAAVAEEALSLSPQERAKLAKLLIESLAGEQSTDEEVKLELQRRLNDLKSGKDSGLSFDQVFGS